MARTTALYGDVYLRARDSNCSFSALVSWIEYGLSLGILLLKRARDFYQKTPEWSKIIRHRIYGRVYLAAALDLAAGEQVQWQLLGRSDLRLQRLAAPPTSPKSKK